MSAKSRKRSVRRTETQRHRDEIIVVTNAARSLGGALLDMLSRHGEHRRLIAIDGEPLRRNLPQGAYHRIYLSKKDAPQKLAMRVPHTNAAITIVHTALPETIDMGEEAASKRLIAEAKHVLAAARKLHVHKLVLVSSADVYGAFATNPAYLTEEMPVRGAEQSPILGALAKIEKLFTGYAEQHHRTTITILRPSTILGARVRDFKTTFFDQTVIPTAMGFDPLVQFVHESDIIRAMLAVIEKDEGGTFNIVGDNLLPLSRAVRMLGRSTVPLPAAVLSTAAQVASKVGLDIMPSSYIPFLMHACIADGNKARRELGFVPVYTSQEALLSFSTKGCQR
jgi:UDP-glucose 4-epimerase